MGLHYVVDGYNVIRCGDRFSGGSLRDQREALLRFIEDRRPHGAAANRVTVVFDGRTDVSSPRWPGPTRVVFSPGRDADAVIKRLVDEMSNPSQAVVVTDDGGIRRWVRGAGARLLSCADFLAAAAGAPRARRRPLLDADEVQDINEELKRLWKLK